LGDAYRNSSVTAGALMNALELAREYEEGE
jgi:hypothetical protein